MLVVALGLMSVLAMGIWKSKAQKANRTVPVSESSSEAEMKLTDMEYTEMQEGKRLWTLTASEAEYFQEEQQTRLASVRLTFFLESGEEIHLQSEEGLLSAGSRNIELWDSVKADLPQGYELLTDRAFYNHQQEVLSSSSSIRINGPDVQLQGSRWEYRIPEHRGMLEGGVQGSLLLAPSEPNPIQ